MIHQVGAIVISPTRELASQIFQVAQPFMDTLPKYEAALLVGGTDVSADIANLKQNGANLLIGTPGRIEDILDRASFLDLKNFEVNLAHYLNLDFCGLCVLYVTNEMCLFRC